MAKEFFKGLPDQSTPLNPDRLNGLLNGNEALGSIVVEDVICKNLFNAYSNYDYATDTFGASYTINNSNKITVASGGGNWSRVGCTISGLKANATYTVSSDITNSNGNKCGLFSTQNSNIGTDTSFKSVITISADANGVLFFCFYHNYSSTNTSVDVIFDNIQVELGEVATEYVPYKNFDNTFKNDILYPFNSNVETGVTYTLANGKKFSDYKLLEFSTSKTNVIKTYSSLVDSKTKQIQLLYYESISGTYKTEIAIELEYVSDTQFKCNRSGYTSDGENVRDNPYQVVIRGII